MVLSRKALSGSVLNGKGNYIAISSLGRLFHLLIDLHFEMLPNIKPCWLNTINPRVDKTHVVLPNGELHPCYSRGTCSSSMQAICGLWTVQLNWLLTVHWLVNALLSNHLIENLLYSFKISARALIKRSLEIIIYRKWVKGRSYLVRKLSHTKRMKCY